MNTVENTVAINFKEWLESQGINADAFKKAVDTAEWDEDNYPTADWDECEPAYWVADAFNWDNNPIKNDWEYWNDLDKMWRTFLFDCLVEGTTQIAIVRGM